MIELRKFVFSPFQENTYVLHGPEKSAWIIDPGCYFSEEKQELKEYIEDLKLNPERLLLTHCHLDHVFGNHFVHETYGLTPEYHKLDEPTMDMAGVSAKMYGVDGFQESPRAKNHLIEGMKLSLENTEFEVVFVPGHAPGHVAFINHDERFVVGGDVLFQRSIGRTDLPGGDFDKLIASIKSQFFSLADDYKVYSGHGPETTIGEEKKHNPFIK